MEREGLKLYKMTVRKKDSDCTSEMVGLVASIQIVQFVPHREHSYRFGMFPKRR